MTTTEPLPPAAQRLLVAIYRLTKGRTGVVVSREEIENEVRREALFDLTDDQFKAYAVRARDEAAAFRSSDTSGAEPKT